MSNNKLNDRASAHSIRSRIDPIELIVSVA